MKNWKGTSQDLVSLEKEKRKYITEYAYAPL